MSSQCYPSAREKFGSAQLSWTSGTLRCVLMAETYHPDLDNEFLVDVPTDMRIAISEAMTGRTITDGFAYSLPISFPLLLSPSRANSAIIFKDTGIEDTSELIFLMESPELVTAPFALEGFDYFIYANLAEGGFFRL